MALQKIGFARKTKSGKATMVSLNDKDLEIIKSTRREYTGKDGKQYTSYSVLVTGSVDSQYGHSLSVITEDGEAPSYENSNVTDGMF